ncbi:chromosomal replication initiator protein DnaA [Candidatus Parcubacteria bacterium]|nr:chromosomal replication initiator protein DnaA [Candidatus Parcubacteria bacterium]
MNNDQIWQAVLGEIELNLSKANFTTWFKNTFISSLDNGRVIISVPNMFTETWLKKKYHDKIKDGIESITSEKIKDIAYKIEQRKNNPVNELFKKQNIATDNITEQCNSNLNNIPQVNHGMTNKFGLNKKYVFDNYIVGKGNELAHAACKAVAANPGTAYNPLFIYGGVGLGKTHLMQAIGNETVKNNLRVLYVTCEKFTNDYVNAVKTGKAKSFKDLYRNVDVLLIDDVQFIAGKERTQEEFFHTFNELHQSNKQIVLTSDRPPKSILSLEKRLLSRFEWGMIADVSKPDIETMVAILETKCKEKNYTLDNKILYYIANNVQNNIRELEGALNRLIVFHEFNNTKPTIDSTKNVLNTLLSALQSKSITGKNIIEATAAFFDVKIPDIIGKSRKKELVYPRQITMYLMRKELGTSFPTIGQDLGGRDHTTAMHACNKIKKEIKENEKVKQDIESVKQQIYTF